MCVPRLREEDQRALHGHRLKARDALTVWAVERDDRQQRGDDHRRRRAAINIACERAISALSAKNSM